MDLCEICAALLPRPPSGGFVSAPFSMHSAGTSRTQTQAPTPTPISVPAQAPVQAPAPGCVLQLAPLRYAWPVDLLVQELKFGGSWPVARVFGHLLANARRELVNPPRALPLPQLVIPVPLHPQRHAERGFNQAEHIASFAAEALGLPLAPPLLQRRRNTAVQSRLSASARQDNLHEAFQVDERNPLMPAEPWDHVALVDDVLTTGSTLAAATSALRRVGVRRIEWWTAAVAVAGSGSVAGAGVGAGARGEARRQTLKT